MDTDTPLPLTPEMRFAGLGGQEVVNTPDGVVFGNLNFGGQSANGPHEYSNNQIRTIAQHDQGVFEVLFPFQGYLFEEPHSRGGDAVFRVLGPSVESSSIYRSSNSADPVRVYGTGDELPGKPGVVAEIFTPRIENNNVLFAAVDSNGVGGVYRTDLNGNNITALLDENTLGVEDTGFLSLGDLEDGYVAFRTRELGSGRHTGVFTSDLSGNVNAIAKLGDPLPGAPGQFIGSFAGDTLHPSISNGRVVYTANGTGNTDGVYVAPVTGGASEVVVDDTMPLPGDSGITRGFALASISGDNVSFIGTSASGTSTGLWVSMGGTLVDIAIRNQEFDGRIVRDVFSSPFSMQGNTVAFEVVFTNGEAGLYLATVTPAPGAGVLLAVGGGWAARRRRGTLVG